MFTHRTHRSFKFCWAKSSLDWEKFCRCSGFPVSCNCIAYTGLESKQACHHFQRESQRNQSNVFQRLIRLWSVVGERGCERNGKSCTVLNLYLTSCVLQYKRKTNFVLNSARCKLTNFQGNISLYHLSAKFVRVNVSHTT